jgi:hypothetical protein
MLPLFVRQGAIIPLGPDIQYTAQYGLEPLTIEIYRGVDRYFTLYEDDGETSAFQNGAYAETDIEVTERVGVCTCRVGEPRGDFGPARFERTLVLNIHSQPQPRAVKCDTGELDALANAESLERVQAGWWWNGARGVLTIKSRKKVQALTVQVS